MQRPSLDPPLPPTPTPAPVVRGGGQGGNVTRVYVRDGVPSATATYEAVLAQRSELRDQLEQIQDLRRSIAQRLREGEVSGADKAGLEARLSALDERIIQMDKQVAQADAQVAQAAAVPGAVTGHEAAERAHRIAERQNEVPEEVFVLGGMFMFIVFLPLSIAFARRIWRRSAAAVSALPAELMDRMHRLEQGVESIAIEVERIGEGQRFMTRVMTDTGARPIGAGPAEPVRQQVRDPLSVRTDTPR